MNVANQKALRIVRDYLLDLDDLSNQRGYTFQQTSYSRWAAQEIRLQMLKKGNVPPLILLEDFQEKMLEYAALNLNTSFVFSVANDVARTIADMLLL